MAERWPCFHGLPSSPERWIQEVHISFQNWELWGGVRGQAKLQSSPERIYRGCSLLVFLSILSGRRSSSAAAGSAIIAATHQIATGA